MTIQLFLDPTTMRDERRRLVGYSCAVSGLAGLTASGLLAWPAWARAHGAPMPPLVAHCMAAGVVYFLAVGIVAAVVACRVKTRTAAELARARGHFWLSAMALFLPLLVFFVFEATGINLLDGLTLGGGKTKNDSGSES